MMLQHLSSKNRRRFPFALGCTSYVIPEDILPNVRALGPLVDDVELVLFETPQASNMLSRADVLTLRRLAQEHEITYTVHLPTDSRAGAPGKDERGRYVAAARRVMEMCAPLEPRAWIVHLEGIGRDAPWAEQCTWRKRCQEVLADLKAAVPCAAPLALENLGYPWGWHQDLAEEAGIRLCCDVGHLWLYFPDSWRSQFEAMAGQVDVIHLHGVSRGEDHLSLRHMESDVLRELLAHLGRISYRQVVTLEVFSEADFVESAMMLEDLWETSSL
jgi:sugar phosphate isomerase/epimerase